MKVIVNVVIKKDNKILMVKEASGDSKGQWNFPAGHLDEGENIFDGAIREAKEETGYDVELTGFIHLQNLVSNNKHVLLIVFLADIVGGNISFDSKEIGEVEFIDIDKIFNMDDSSLRSADARKTSIKKVLDGKIYPLEIIANLDYRN